MIFLSLLLLHPLLQQGDASGPWQGQVKLPVQMLDFSVNLMKTNETWVGTIRIPLDVISYSVQNANVSRAVNNMEDIQYQELELERIKIRGRKIQFKATDGPLVAWFMGKLSKEGDAIKGSLRMGRQAFSFSLAPAI